MNFLELVPVPKGINQGVQNAKLRTALDILGPPRDRATADCQPVTARRLAPLMVTADVGPFGVTGIAPAVDSLRDILADVQREQPELAGLLGSAGMLCCRQVRGSKTGAWSNHAWGWAIDLLIGGRLDRRGDNHVYTGLMLLSPVFNRHGWFHGVAFGTEDAMHFEAGDALIRDWHAKGLFGDAANLRPSEPVGEVLNLGDRGPEVRALQFRLVESGHHMVLDGVFGSGTEMAVMRFQTAHGLDADGIVGAETRRALGL